MPVDNELARLTCVRLGRTLAQISHRAQPESVHRFRTLAARVESYLLEVFPKLDGNQKKLLKALKRLRKKAGRTRDLDVQTAALRGLRLSEIPAGKSQLLRVLMEERAKRLRKLEKSFDKETIEELRKRLRRMAKEISMPENFDPLKAALRLFLRSGEGPAPLTEKRLHQFRLVAKSARYVAELAGDDPDARAAVSQLQHMQDVIGDWHDWLDLTSRATQLLAKDPDTALLVALRNLTRAKHRLAVQVLTETQKQLRKQWESAPGAKPPVAAFGPRPSAAVA